MRIACVVAIMVGLTGCHLTPSGGSGKTHTLITRLSIEQVKEIAVAGARANGFQAAATDPWTLSLQISPEGYIWTLNLQRPGRIEPYWIKVEDGTGLADFVFPQLSLGESPKGAEWLFEVARALPEIKYPLPLGAFAKQARVPDLDTSSGGSDLTGRVFFDHVLRWAPDAPARFELRFYCDLPQGFNGPKIVTRAELAYIDAKLNRYLLARPNQ